MSNYFIICC